VEGEKAAAAKYDSVAVAARGMAHAAEILQGKYTLIITNVPFLARRHQAPALRAFVIKHYAEAKGDLATVFLSRASA